jgi:hypothetical protein
MSIEEEGFLSPDIAEWIGKHRAANVDWFNLAGDLNRLAQAQLAKLTVRDVDHQSLIVALCFIRGLSLFQGSVIMVERGMVTEARTLVRSCLETLFFMGAAHKRSDIGDLLMQHDAHHRKKIAERFLSSLKFSDAEDERLKALLTAFLEDQKASGWRGQRLPFEQAARMADLGDVYDTFYGPLSNDSAHPSLVSLNRHGPADGSPGLRWGPGVPDVKEAISYACTACIYTIKIAEERFGAAGLEDRWDKCWRAYKALIDAESSLS